MINIFRDFIEANFSYDILDVLDTYAELFNQLGIDISDDSRVINPWNDDELQCSLKWILLETAKDNNIIPADFNLIEHCDYDDPFILGSIEDLDKVNRIAKAFKDWCGLTLTIDE